MKNEKFKRTAAIALAVTICAASLTGCGSGGQKPNAGKDAPKQSQQVETKKSSKNTVKENQVSPALKEDPAGKDDTPAANLPAADPGQDIDPKDSAVKGKEDGKAPAAGDTTEKDPKGSVKTDATEDGKDGAEKKGSAASKGSKKKKGAAAQKSGQQKSGGKAPAAGKSASSAAKSSTVNSGK